jgi:hypothetical protein
VRRCRGGTDSLGDGPIGRAGRAHRARVMRTCPGVSRCSWGAMFVTAPPVPDRLSVSYFSEPARRRAVKPGRTAPQRVFPQPEMAGHHLPNPQTTRHLRRKCLWTKVFGPAADRRRVGCCGRRTSGRRVSFCPTVDFPRVRAIRTQGRSPGRRTGQAGSLYQWSWTGWRRFLPSWTAVGSPRRRPTSTGPNRG